ncbi:MAG: DNA-3-methyladenine glycosylase 2 family protein [Actinomycetota bacterium]|nr:MAG: DNA-3-methyladenine glycosylase 2 family protein [Actinomycetota bacterium]
MAVTKFSDPIALKEALAELTNVDPVIAGLASRYGVPVLDKKSLVDFTVDGEETEARSVDDGLFCDLVEVVIHQQLAGKAAVAITARFKAALGNLIVPGSVIDCDQEMLRASGLSGAKLAAIRGLALAIDSGAISLSSMAELSDEEITRELSKLRGFGPWSAQMFLMFSLGRLDVWPTGDLGVRKGYSHSYRLETIPSAKELSVLGDRFRPYRSLVAWYMWKSLADPSE